MPAFPCKDCPNKGCGAYHNQCIPYLEAVSKNEEIKQKRMQESIIHDHMFQNHVKIERYMKHADRYYKRGKA